MEDWSKTQAADKARKEREETRNDGDFIKLADGESCLVVFVKPPVGYRQVWLGDHGELYDEVKHDGKRPQGRFMYSVALKSPDKNAYSPAIFDASGEAFDQIDTALDEYGAVNVFKLQRKGTGTKTKYVCLFKRKLEGGELEAVKAIDPMDAQAILDARRDNESGGSSSEPQDTPQAAGDVWA